MSSILDAAVERALAAVPRRDPDPSPTAAETLERARAAVRKVDQMGPRGTTLVTMQEIEAMAMMLVIMGLRPYAAPVGVTETTKGATP